MSEAPDISCLIATRNRAESLRVTLECLAHGFDGGLRCEVVVVDNASDDDATRKLVESFRAPFSIRYLREPLTGLAGKSHCLNRALNTGGLGEIIAVMDDDMSPQPGWFQAVAAICARWPDKDIFSGISRVVWPSGEVPDWALEPRIRGWAYSVMNGGASDRMLERGRWFSGNHFWFRSRALGRGHRFPARWNGEAGFQMDLQEDGSEGVSAPDAVTDHRIQPGLLEYETILERAALVGRNFAETRLTPFRRHVRVAVAFRKSPVLFRIYALGALCAWHARSRLARFTGGLEGVLIATERETYYLNLLRIAAQTPDYRIPWL